MILTSAPNVLKHFTSVIYECSQQARVFNLASLSSLV
jgi:hypothetical protein